ncbi:MAG: electron transfer flavoprotein subunit beta/FixA family protein [Nitrososphaerales archaeon]|jgi:electron transfer flavoprotein beta subunit
MRFAVCVKHAVDESELKIDPSGKPRLEGAQAKMGTFDKNAVEEVLRLRTALGGEVVAITVGKAEARKSLKEALAMGADKGVHILADPGALDPSRTSELLAAAITKTGPFDLVICSEGSSDIYSGLVPPMVAERLGIPYIGYARKLEVAARTVKAERSLEESLESVESSLPSVVSVVSEINEPRYPTLIQIMQASKKPVEELTRQQLGVGDVQASVRIVSMTAQAMNRKRIVFEGSPDEAASKLVDAFASEGVIPK